MTEISNKYNMNNEMADKDFTKKLDYLKERANQLKTKLD